MDEALRLCLIPLFLHGEARVPAGTMSSDNGEIYFRATTRVSDVNHVQKNMGFCTVNDKRLNPKHRSG